MEERSSTSFHVEKPFKNHKQLSVEFCGLSLDSPTMLASGVLGISFELFSRIVSSGCGAIVSKSIGVEPREGYRNPTMTGVEAGYLNAIGLANPGVEIFAKELEEFNKTSSNTIPLIVSIFADTPENFARITSRFDGDKFLAFELNLSCPHVKDVGSEIGGDLNLSAKVISAVKDATDKPVFVKMPASIMNVPTWGREIEKSGADGIVAINTVRAMSIDIHSKRPILSNKIGGLSGKAIKPIGVRAVYELYDSVDIPIIGVGGVSDWSDAVEYYLAGASCVQIGSAMAGDFLKTFENVNYGICTYMKSSGYTNLAGLIGDAHN